MLAASVVLLACVTSVAADPAAARFALAEHLLAELHDERFEDALATAVSARTSARALRTPAQTSASSGRGATTRRDSTRASSPTTRH